MSIAEVKAYTKPQEAIELVMKATMMLLGEREETLQVSHSFTMERVLNTGAFAVVIPDATL